MRSARPITILLLLCFGASASASTYTLQWGDTLGKVAAKFDIPIAALTAANGITNANKVKEGQTLTVPDRKAAMVAVAKPIVAISPTPPADGSKLYDVKAGDTLSGIAKKFTTSVAELRTLNGLKKDTIREGKSLKLPASVAIPPAMTPICPVKDAGKFDFSNSFGAPRHGGRKHMGNDIFAKRGTPVLASVDGTLRKVTGALTGIGYYLDGDDGVTYYGAHMNEIKVVDGRVTQGTVVGTVGTTGNAQGTPAHLHFEVKPGNGTSIDPYPYLRTWCR
jgi:murein DD-endopeptidase MepM/ murein hydrolase activator NlpD